MEERNENLSFNDDFKFKNKPDESTPKSAENLNVALDNTSWLKRYIDDIVTGKIDLIVGNLKSKNILKLFSYDKTITVSGISCSINKDGLFTLNGTASSNVYMEFFYKFNDSNSTSKQDSDSISLDSSKKYVFSMQKILGTCDGTLRITLSINKDTTAVVVDKNETYKVFENATGINRAYISIPINTKLTNYQFVLQVELGDKVTDYVCHKEF